jgi:3-oxoacyl-[acyl-carrier-protein] synthase-3
MKTPSKVLSPKPLSVGASRGGRIVGFGAAQPAQSITADELGDRYQRSGEWIEARTGIRSVRRISGGESLVGLATTASAQAIRNSGLQPGEIDLVIAATCSIRAGEPQLARQLVGELSLRAAAFDLNAACSGFCYAISAADAMIRTGAARRVLVIAAEQMTNLIDPADLGTGIIFGHGAGAVVVSAGLTDAPDIGPVAWGSDGSQSNLIAFDDDGGYMRMQGQHVFRWAVETIHEIAADACRRAGITTAEIDVFVPHQANLRIIDAMVRKLGIENKVIATDVVQSGNTSSASIPIALTKLTQTGAVKSGQLALLVGFGAGLAYAAQVVRLP